MTYEYLCTSCGHEWEADQRISEPPLTDCPSCGIAAAKRQVSGGMGFVLKGSGWYSDLYGLKPKAQGADASPAKETSKGANSGSASNSSGGAKSVSKESSAAAPETSGGSSSPSKKDTVTAPAAGVTPAA